jgi:IclR family acetate operon transcriptional repressor
VLFVDEISAYDERDASPVLRPAGLIGAVDNVLRLLRLFEKTPVLRVNQVARDMNLSRSTVHRILTTLGYHGYVEQDEFSRGYRPGPALVDLGLSVVRGIDVRAVAHVALLQLRDLTGESAHLAVWRGTEVLFLDSVESSKMLRTGNRTGWSFPAHATAAGKALLAALTDDEVSALYPTGHLDPATPNTTRTVEELCKQLAEIRELGYAVNIAEAEVDVCAVAVVVRDARGRTRGAISITAPRSRAGESWISDAAAAGRGVAADLAHRLD